MHYFYNYNSKIYNPYEYKPISIAIKNSIFNKEVAIPEYCPCKGHKTINYTHKKDCNGILYLCNVENYFLKKKVGNSLRKMSCY